MKSHIKRLGLAFKDLGVDESSDTFRRDILHKEIIQANLSESRMDKWANRSDLCQVHSLPKQHIKPRERTLRQRSCFS